MFARGARVSNAQLVVTLAAVSMVLVACGSARPAAQHSSRRVPSAGVRDPAPLEDPCRAGTPAPADEIGITPDRIVVGVVADVTGPRASFAANWDAMQAFAAACNDRGGIGGRTLEVRLFNTNVLDRRGAIERSCSSTFALVGSAAVFDGAGSDLQTDCAIPDISAVVAEPAHARVPSLVTPFPNPQNQFLVAPQAYLARTQPKAVRRAAMAYLGVGVTALRAKRQIEASRAVGYRFIASDAFPALASPSEIQRVADRIASRDPGYLSVQARVSDLVALQTALAATDAMPPVVDAGPLFYDPSYLEQAQSAAEGTWIQVLTTPLEDTPSVPELERYRTWLARTVPSAVPTAQGVRAWSAALLFAEGARRAGPGLDRASLLAELRGIHEWDGNGIQVPSDPGANRMSSCFAYLRVSRGQFVRAHPARGFSCPRNGVVRLTRDFRHL